MKTFGTQTRAVNRKKERELSRKCQVNKDSEEDPGRQNELEIHLRTMAKSVIELVTQS